MKGPKGSDRLKIEQVLTVLRETPGRVAGITAGLTPIKLRGRPGNDEWSANDVLAHLRACADVWGGCMFKIISEERPTLKAINPRAWIESTDYPEQEFCASLRAFTKQRAELMSVLEPLPSSGWSRSATVTGAGAVLVRTVLIYAERLARHERPHVKQIERIVQAVR
ncbi:MAG TPA: DinB family protein [Candidatus Dormibacteraeota bacterium]